MALREMEGTNTRGLSTMTDRLLDGPGWQRQEERLADGLQLVVKEHTDGWAKWVVE
jgi:hypothetical protein